MSVDTVVMVQLQVEHCTAEVYLNDVPISRIDQTPGRVKIENVAVEQLLVPGDNRLELVLEPGSKPSLARTERREIPFRKLGARARLVRFLDGEPALPDAGYELAATELAWSDASVERRVVPASSMVSADLGAAHGRWRFMDAPELTLDEQLVNEACALLDQLEYLIRSGDMQGILDLSAVQLEDAMHAYPAVTMDFLRDDLVDAMNHYRSGPDPVLPRDRERHDFRLAAGGRLVHLVDDDWSPSFKVRNPTTGNAIGFPLFLARIGDRLRIVR
jgi:hypothetical protein